VEFWSPQGYAWAVRPSSPFHPYLRPFLLPNHKSSSSHPYSGQRICALSDNAPFNIRTLGTELMLCLSIPQQTFLCALACKAKVDLNKNKVSYLVVGIRIFQSRVVATPCFLVMVGRIEVKGKERIGEGLTHLLLYLRGQLD
jgi:hypothetical protein